MPEPPRTPEELLDRLERDGIEHLWVTYHDYSGVPRAKTIPRSGFRGAVRDGVVFAMANVDLDILDIHVVGATLLADSGDMLAVPDPRSYVVMPRYPATARVQAWLRASDGGPWQGCPRTRLQTAVDALADAGYSAQVSLEPEFYLLQRNDDGAYQPVNSVRAFQESGLAVEQAFVRRVVDDLEAMGITVAQLGKEFGPGQYEMTVRHGPPLDAVDHSVALKGVVRDAARAQGYTATFMPKVNRNWAGCSLHLHLSIWDADGTRDITASETDEISLSDPGRWFMGGILAHLPALTGLGSPTVNSYKRLLPGSWAPANTYWGYRNRSAVIRIPGEGKRRHLEFRSGDNSCQPALFVAGVLAAGLDGIRNQIDPAPPFQGDVAHLRPEEIVAAGIGFLPRTLPEALAALEADAVIAAAVGPIALEHLLLVKRHELAQYDLEVHPWERDTYLEVI
ncbi:MAG: glutamine synthetase family protein [Thermomicrobiales bacterium]